MTMSNNVDFISIMYKKKYYKELGSNYNKNQSSREGTCWKLLGAGNVLLLDLGDVMQVFFFLIIICCF